MTLKISEQKRRKEKKEKDKDGTSRSYQKAKALKMALEDTCPSNWDIYQKAKKLRVALEEKVKIVVIADGHSGGIDWARLHECTIYEIPFSAYRKLRDETITIYDILADKNLKWWLVV